MKFFRRELYNLNTTNFTLIQISSFRGEKGHYYTLKALRKYIDETKDDLIRLTVSGDKGSENYRTVKEFCRELNLTDYVQFVGLLNPNQVKTALENSHCSVLHSVTTDDGDQEGIPNALMEAMSMEMPIISSIHAGIPELLTKESFSYLVEERDVDQYVEAIKHIRKNWRWAPENRKIISDKFSSQIFISNINLVYRSISNAE